MNRPNWIVWAEIAGGAALALAAVIAAAERHGRRRVLKQSRAIGTVPALDSLVAAALRDLAAGVEPSPDALARILDRTRREAA